MLENKIRKNLLKKGLMVLLIIEIITIIGLIMLKSQTIYYFVVPSINFIVYYFILSVPHRKIFDSYFQYEDAFKIIIQKFNFKMWLYYFIFPITFLLISYFSRLKLWTMSISIILLISFAYAFKKKLLKIENKVAKFDYYNKTTYVTNNKFFSDTFLFTIPLLLDIYNSMFSFSIKYFTIVIVIYFLSIFLLISKHIFYFANIKEVRDK